MPAKSPFACQLPDMLLIGWIPQDLQVRRASRRREWAMQMLERSANVTPPDTFASLAAVRAHFAPFIATGSREYRAIAMLEGAIVTFHPTGRDEMPTVETGHAMEVGYTPIRLSPHGRMTQRKSRLAAYLERLGAKREHPHRGPADIIASRPGLSVYLRGAMVEHAPVLGWDNHEPETIDIRFRLEFKLGSLPNVIGRILTGYWAPHARIDVTIRVSLTAPPVIIVTTTAVPSVRLYVGDAASGALRVCHEHDMRSSPDEALDVFVESVATGCRPAPHFGEMRWRGDGP